MMMETREILEASPSGAPFGVAQLAAAIEACLNCIQACTSCADADLAEDDIAEMRTCIALCLNCADVCQVTARVLSRPAHWEQFVADRLLQACVRTCTSSAEECARHADHHRHCAICERVCRVCAQACSALLDAEASKELKKLAGA
jgi:hypothetical protein